jgi:outer membrane protein assembly factor BamB
MQYAVCDARRTHFKHIKNRPIGGTLQMRRFLLFANSLWLILLFVNCRQVVLHRPVAPPSLWLTQICPDPADHRSTNKHRNLDIGERIHCHHNNVSGMPRWVFQANERIVSTPKRGFDGSIYINSLDNTLYAIAPDGSRKWNFRANDLVLSSPETAIDGTVYFAAKNGYVYAIQNGLNKWSPPYFAIDEIHSSPKVAPDGTIYIATRGSQVHAISPNKRRYWVYQGTDAFQGSTPELSPDGLNIYVGSVEGSLHAIHSDNFLSKGQSRAKWVTKLCNRITASPAVSADGTIFIGCWDGRLFAVSPRGDIRWSFNTGHPLLATPRIGYDGQIYIGSDDNWLYALNRMGKCLWRFKSGVYKKLEPGTAKPKTSETDISTESTSTTPVCAREFPSPDIKSPYIFIPGTESYIQASAAISSRGKTKSQIYFGSINEYIYSLSPKGELLWVFDSGGWIDNAPIIGRDGNQEILYVAAGSRLYAINP